MDVKAKEWKKRFEKVWDLNGEGRYREGSPGKRMVKYFIQHCQKGQTVNEYGSGTGRAVVELLRVRPGTQVHMVDIADNAMEEEGKAELKRPGSTLTFAIAPLWKLPPKFPHADWGLCIEVLCFLPPEKLDDSLSEIRRTCDNLFCQVYERSDKRCGMELTTIPMSEKEWFMKLREFWRHVEPYPHPETPGGRYLFTCR